MGKNAMKLLKNHKKLRNNYIEIGVEAFQETFRLDFFIKNLREMSVRKMKKNLSIHLGLKTSFEMKKPCPGRLILNKEIHFNLC